MVIPNDQMSALVSYDAPVVMTSGAIQYGVPMNVVRLEAVDGRSADTPKSHRRTRFGIEVMRMLAADVDVMSVGHGEFSDM
jgi:hypothetical protein